MAKVKVTNLGIEKVPNQDHVVVIKWTLAKARIGNTEEFIVDYDYAYSLKSDGSYNWTAQTTITHKTIDVRLNGTRFELEHSANAGAIAMRTRVKPVAKPKSNKDKNPKFKSDFCGWASVDFRVDQLQTPTMNLSYDKYTNRATIEVTANDAMAHRCAIIILDGESDNWARDAIWQNYYEGKVTAVVDIPPGRLFGFSAASWSTSAAAQPSNWCERQYAEAKPATPAMQAASAYGENGITATWSAVAGAKSYTVEHCPDAASYFDSNRTVVTTTTGITGTTFVAENLALGHTYYVRVQAVNDSGESSWSNVKEAKLALEPDAPTTFDTEPSYMVGDSAYLRWRHNCEDDSEQTAARISLDVGGTVSTINLDGSDGKNEYYSLPLDSYADSTVVMWQVQTKGQHSEWSPASVWRQFSVFDEASVTCSLSQPSGAVDDDEHPLLSLPLTATLSASGGGGVVAGYHVTIKAGSAFLATYADGSSERIAAGSTIYERDYVTTESEYEVDFGVEARIPDGCTVYVIAEVTMQSNLRSTSDAMPALVDFNYVDPEPDGECEWDPDDLKAIVTCACYEYDQDGDPTGNLLDGVTLSVYRVDQDGTLTRIAYDLPNNGNMTVVDPHANFGACAYRIVATSTSTGAISDYEVEADSPHSTCVVQWDESWLPETYQGEDDEHVGWRIDDLYNLVLEESTDVESEDVNYIGRKFPVSYYGTQRGYSASFQTEFPKSDVEKVEAARRLLVWNDDVYVREPSGTGYWAHVRNPTLSRDYSTEAMRLSFTATRVDRTDDVR